ncbi:hypothetical protein ACOBV9_22800 (plasmid) [Pseudoalteromonas espejiana]
MATDGQPKHEDIAGVLAHFHHLAEEFANHSVQLAGHWQLTMMEFTVRF